MGRLLFATCSILTVGDNSNQPVRCCEAKFIYSGMSLHRWGAWDPGKAEQYKHRCTKCSSLQWVSVLKVLCSRRSVKQQTLKLRSNIKEKPHSTMQANTSLKSLPFSQDIYVSICICGDKLTLSHQGISLQKGMPGLFQRPSISSNRDHRNH